MCFLLVLKNKRQAVTTYPPQLPAWTWACERLKATASSVVTQHLAKWLVLLQPVSVGLTLKVLWQRNWLKGDKESWTCRLYYVALPQSLKHRKIANSFPLSLQDFIPNPLFSLLWISFCHRSNFEERVLQWTWDTVAGREHVLKIQHD